MVLTVLATARITRLITADSITEPLRKRITGRLSEESRVVYLVHCPWCVSIYVGTVLAYLAWRWGETGWFAVATLALSASYVAGLLSVRED
jgi:Protein of unknown function (DUF1360)